MICPHHQALRTGQLLYDTVELEAQGSCSSRGYLPVFWLQIVSLQDIKSLGDLDIGQKCTFICCELECTLGHTQNMANILLCEPAIFTIHLITEPYTS